MVEKCNEIIIKGVKIKYTPIELFWEKSPALSREILKKEFLEFKKIFDKNNLEFSLTCGTLLGAIRENNFIEYDNDVDIIIKDENKLLKIIPEIQGHDFKFIRYQNEQKYIIYTFIKTNVYIDVYLAVATGNYYYLWGGKIKKIFVDKLIKHEFIGEQFLIPKCYKKLLVLLYGKNWRIPAKNKPGNEFINQDKILAMKIIIFEFIRKMTPQKIRTIMKKNFFIKKIRNNIYQK